MTHVRMTYPGAYHHVMNRGYDGNNIFCGAQSKNNFLEYLQDASKKMRIKVFAYCVLDNHYHLVLENTSGRLSDFLRLLNSNYALFYRKVNGGKGYVFQDRFKSTLIENDGYLLQSIIYLLRNPVRAGIIRNAEDYNWSSVACYFSDCKSDIVDANYIKELFGSQNSFRESLNSLTHPVLDIKPTDIGEILGNDGFFGEAIEKFNRRKQPHQQSHGIQRVDDRYFEPVEKVFRAFEKINNVEIDNINLTTNLGKRLRGELLVLLKERAGLKYKEIGEFGIFSDLCFSSLRSIYRNMKKKTSKA